MLQTITKTLKHSAIYGLGRISTPLVGLVLLPLYTDKIAVADYGVYALLQLVIQLSTIMFTFGLQLSLFRWLSLNDDARHKGSILFTALCSALVVAFCILVLGMKARGSLSGFLFDSGTYTHLFTYVFVIVAIEIIRTILFTVVRVYQKAALYTTLSVLSLVLNLSLNVYLIAHLGYGIEGILISSLASSALITTVLFVYFIRFLTFTLDLPALWGMLKFGFPLIFSTISSLIINMSDRYFISMFLPLQFVGQYAFVYKVGSIVNMFLIQSFLMAWPAIAWENAKKASPERFLSKVSTYFVFVATWATLALAVLSKEALNILAKNPEYKEAYQLIPVIAASFVFLGLYTVVGFTLHYKSKTKYFAFIVGLSAGVKIVLNLLLIPVWGLPAAAASTLIAYVVMAVLCYVISRRFLNLVLERRRLAIAGISGTLLITLYVVLEALNVHSSLYFSAFLILLFPAVLYVLRFFDDTELAVFRSLLGRRPV